MRWLLPPDEFFLKLRVPKLQFVPILVDDREGFPLEANLYVTERSLGEWAPALKDGQDPVVPTLRSRGNIASRICAFFQWLDKNPDLDWKEVEYLDHLLLRYQPQLLRGQGSASGKPLEASTVNLYLDEASSFLSWAAIRGHRGPFKVPSSRKHAHPLDRRNSKLLSTRHGKIQIRESSALDRLPMLSELQPWISSVKARHPVKALIFELMMRTGLRISEANQLRLTCFPREIDWKSSWRERGEVPVSVKYGVKGGKVEPSSSLSTRSRLIFVPVDLAERIEHYVAYVRPTLLSRYRLLKPTSSSRTDRLWLGETKLQPVSNQMLYAAWTEAQGCPLGWHPHSARHFFAVEKLMSATKDLLKFHEIDNAKSVGFGWLYGLMAGHATMLLAPTLGHVREATTMRYLRCVLQRLTEDVGHPGVVWNALIDSDGVV